MSVVEEVEAFKRKLLQERLDQLSEQQVAFFKRLYPKDVPESSLISAIELCDRTLRKNLAKIGGK